MISFNGTCPFKRPVEHFTTEHSSANFSGHGCTGSFLFTVTQYLDLKPSKYYFLMMFCDLTLSLPMKKVSKKGVPTLGYIARQTAVKLELSV